MAEDNNQENEKKSPLKLILMIVGGIALLGVGIGVGRAVGLLVLTGFGRLVLTAVRVASVAAGAR